MKTFFRTLFAIAALTFSAHAQTPGLVTVMNGGTNNIAGNADAGTSVVNSYTNQVLVLDAQYSEFVAMELEGTGIATTNTHLKFYFVPTLTYPTAGNRIATNEFNIPMVIQGTNTYRLATNFNIGNIPYLWLTKIENTSSNAVTNLSIRYFYKPKH